MTRHALLLGGAVAVLGGWLAAMFLLPIEPFVIGQTVAAACVLFLSSRAPPLRVRWILTAEGRAVRAGNFDSDDQSVRALRALEKSAVATELRKRSMDVSATDGTREDVTLYRAIVEESARRLREIWPGLEFHIIYWDVYDVVGRYPLFEDGWRPAGATVHPISKILPATDDYLRVYKLRDEVHPNAYADDLIASYVAREILRAPVQ